MSAISIIQSGVSTTLHSTEPTALLSDADGVARVETWLVGGTGTGMAPLHRLTERGPQQHGSTDRGFLLDPRTIAYVFELWATNGEADLDDGRDALYALFTPTDTPLQLRIDRANGTVRQIACHFKAGLAMDTNDMEGPFSQKVGVILDAGDTLWYDPTQIAETFGATGASVGMAIPWLIPWKLGASSISQSRALIYTGTFETSPEIRIVGPITSPVITNLSSPGLDKLDFTGTTIAGGTYYIVDAEEKTVVDSAGTNQISKLTSDSDLSTFALHPHPIAAGGVNTISIGGTGISAATQIYINYYVRYIGV